jgi:hypothetical protein
MKNGCTALQKIKNQKNRYDLKTITIFFFPPIQHHHNQNNPIILQTLFFCCNIKERAPENQLHTNTSTRLSPIGNHFQRNSVITRVTVVQ